MRYTSHCPMGRRRVSRETATTYNSARGRSQATLLSRPTPARPARNQSNPTSPRRRPDCTSPSSISVTDHGPVAQMALHRKRANLATAEQRTRARLPVPAKSLLLPSTMVSTSQKRFPSTDVYHHDLSAAPTEAKPMTSSPEPFLANAKAPSSSAPTIPRVRVVSAIANGREGTLPLSFHVKQ